MLALVSRYFGGDVTYRKFLPCLRRCLQTCSDGTLKLKTTFLLEHFDNSDNRWKTAGRYLRLQPDDITALMLCGWREAWLQNFKAAEEYCGRLKKLVPDPVFFEFMFAPGFRPQGSPREQLEMAAAWVTAYPQFILLRTGLVLILIDSGRLDEAWEQLSAALELAPSDELLVYCKAEIHLRKNEFPAACNELRKYIGLTTTEALKPETYAKLYRIYKLSGNEEQAQKSLKIARNLSPELDLKTLEEISGIIQKLKFSGEALEGFSRAAADFALEEGKNAISRGIKYDYNNLDYASAFLYRFEKDSAPRGLCIWLFHNTSVVNGYLRMTAFLQAPPLSSFTDCHGNILKTEFKKRISRHYGDYAATIHFNKPVELNNAYAVAVEPDMEKLWKKLADGSVEFKLEQTPHTTVSRAIILALPEDAEILSLSPEPDRRATAGGETMLVYSGFFPGNRTIAISARFRIP